VSTALVTGATAGLGWHTARLLGAAGWTVLVHGRTPEKAAAAVQELGPGRYEPVAADFGRLSEVEDLAGRVGAVDVLVNNAGVLANTARQVTADGHELHWGVNYLAGAWLTELLPAGRVVSVCSTMPLPGGFRWDDLELTRDHVPRIAYAQSKIALAMSTLDCPHGIAVSPGYVDTKLVRNAFGGAVVPAAAGAAHIAAAVTDLADRAGIFVDRDRIVDPPPPANDPAARERLRSMFRGGVPHHA
jgi:NAD(P)-dependent dehydrogenase (short-subunit alcohol dehydrogenase family)